MKQEDGTNLGGGGGAKETILAILKIRRTWQDCVPNYVNWTS